MAHVLGGVDGAPFADFVHYARVAYVTLRRHSGLLITLFSLMISCGLPELRSAKNIDWMRKALRLDLEDDDEAAAAFVELIHACLNTRTTQLNDMFHMLKRAYRSGADGTPTFLLIDAAQCSAVQCERHPTHAPHA